MSLLETVLRHAPEADIFTTTAVPGLMLMRASHSHLPRHVNYQPSLCLVLAGEKEVMLGEEAVRYRGGEALVVNMELPLLSRVTEGPYVGLSLAFDTAAIREVLGQIDRPPEASARPTGLFVEPLAGPLADAVQRLVDLLARPEAIPALSGSIMREIYYWLLSGPNGGEIAKLGLPDSHTQRIAEAIGVLRGDLARPIRIDELAGVARMSPSSFHQYFKLLTALTPLQYQKQLRLLEARRLMVAGAANVAKAAYQVGYESVSQFSREYARMFGAPPKRNVAALRANPPPVVV